MSRKLSCVRYSAPRTKRRLQNGGCKTAVAGGQTPFLISLFGETGGGWSAGGEGAEEAGEGAGFEDVGPAAYLVSPFGFAQSLP